jgi:uncharacterized alkaline shock family protein YloU
MYDQLKNMDVREIELPDTVFIRDIETRVFQGIVLQSLAKIEGIGLLEGNLFDSLLGREIESVKGIHVEQDQKRHSVNIRVEINIIYGISIPQKSEEIQMCLVEQISKWTGLHVGSVHIIFKDLILASSETAAEEAVPAAESGEFEVLRDC